MQTASVNPPADLRRTWDSPLLINGESGPRPEDVSPSALVLSNDESFVLRTASERTRSCAWTGWGAALRRRTAQPAVVTLLQVTICRELAERLNGSFMLTDELDPSEREPSPNGESRCPRAKRPAERTLASFFLPVQK